MLRRALRKPSMAVAIVAVFFSLTGTGLAVSRYVITSSKQIKPSVLRQLHGRAGVTGPAGPTGASGPKDLLAPPGLAT